MGLIALFAKYQAAFAAGFFVTVQLSLIIWSVGLLLGGAIGVAGARWPVVGAFFRTLSFLIGSIPVIVVLIWFYYPAQSLAGVMVPPFWTAAIALSIVNVFIVSDTVRPALVGFPREYVAAGRLAGLSETNVFRKITLPLLMRQLVPSLLFSQVAMLHATLFASLISVREIFRVTQEINAQEYQPVVLFTALALLFLTICAPINGIALYLRRRYSRDLSEI
jgi:ABC-type amino acid transport system permease subunit